MNYRHAFHAGNFADVVKHAVLAILIWPLGATIRLHQLPKESRYAAIGSAGSVTM